GKPSVDGGDYLQLNTTLFADKVGGRKLSITSVGQGHWDFSDPGNTRPVYFESIERFNHVAITASTVDAGSGTQVVTVRDAETGAVKFQVVPYESGYRGGVSVAVGDVNSDGIPDLITVAGANHAPTVKVYSGTPNAARGYPHVQLASSAAFNTSFRSGASLAVGDVNHDGANDLVVAAGRGWLPQVKVFSGKALLSTRALVRPAFNAFEATFRGGVNVAV